MRVALLAALFYLALAAPPAIRFIDIAAESGLTVPNTFGGNEKKDFILESTGTPLLPNVVVSGGADRLDTLMHRDWPGKWKFRAVTDATMRGLGTLTPVPRS